jgi:hypothetical protein
MPVLAHSSENHAGRWDVPERPVRDNERDHDHASINVEPDPAAVTHATTDRGSRQARWRADGDRQGRGTSMAAMKPRTGDGPLEVTKEGRGIVMRVPLEGGGRLVVELSADEASALGDALKEVVG